MTRVFLLNEAFVLSKIDLDSIGYFFQWMIWRESMSITRSTMSLWRLFHFSNLPIQSSISNDIGRYTDPRGKIESNNHRFQWWIWRMFSLTTNTMRMRYTMIFLKFCSTIPRISCLILFEEDHLNQTGSVRYHLAKNHILCHIDHPSRWFVWIMLKEIFLHVQWW